MGAHGQGELEGKVGREAGVAGRDQRRAERLARQREYQREYRKRIKSAREPDRDEIARELLHYAITENLKNNREDELWHLADNVIARLAARGYDRAATERAFVDIVERYGAGWDFQRRLHLVGGGSEADLRDGGDS
ncbi:MAG: hypothetical protein KKE67_19955 [Alphaproteobacteria bacterium]|nr:hypothetical protein [Alphaproteobacteria bacterium]MBU1790255.1 hypothetical protein [Alphaproteobacteria bacterium]MBU2405895.1 hypothetical protein [Alphaproteobacteria bacterium]